MGELNLLPYNLRKRQISNAKKRKYLSFTVLAVMILLLAFCIPVLLYFTSISRENAAQEKLDEEQVLYNKNAKIEYAISMDNLYLKSVDMMTKQKYYTKDNITVFQDYMTKDMHLKSFTYNRKGVMISGSAKDYNSPSVFTANMQLSGKFFSVKLTGITTTKEGVDFTIVVVY